MSCVDSFSRAAPSLWRQTDARSRFLSRFTIYCLQSLRTFRLGKAISIVPEHQQLMTQRAADILGVSRPFLVGLLESGQIPFHMVGSHRRIYLRDLLDYKRQRDQARHEAINNMARAEMEAGTYDKVVLPDGAQDE